MNIRGILEEAFERFNVRQAFHDKDQFKAGVDRNFLFVCIEQGIRSGLAEYIQLEAEATAQSMVDEQLSLVSNALARLLEQHGTPFILSPKDNAPNVMLELDEHGNYKFTLEEL